MGDDDEGPCVPMVLRCDLKAHYTDEVKNLLPLDTWCPVRSGHLEDGPTWLPSDRLLLQAADAHEGEIQSQSCLEELRTGTCIINYLRDPLFTSLPTEASCGAEILR